MLTVLLAILVACNSTDNSSSASENQSDNNDAAKVTKEDSADTKNNEQDKEEDTANSAKSTKEEYLKKLNETKREMEEQRNNPEDDSTFGLVLAETDRFDVWEDLLNEVYGILEKQLPADEMEQLKQEQQEWRKQLLTTAKMTTPEGETKDPLERARDVNDFTEERAFELVEKYMK